MESIFRYVRAPPPCDDDDVNRGNNSGETGREGSEHEFDSDADSGAGVEDREGDVDSGDDLEVFDSYVPSHGASDVEHSGYSSGSCDEDATKPKRSGGAKPKNIGYRVQQLEDFLSLPALASSRNRSPAHGVPANKLYEQRYIRNFEMAADLNNARDPIIRSQLLLISVGEEMQGIIKAADLQPALDSPVCYQKFTSNIVDYLRALTDPASELDDCSRMKQEKSEKAISFLARIKEKAKLCGYSAANLDYHVHFHEFCSQLHPTLGRGGIPQNARGQGTV
ncbi:hypothetical protein pipiens_004773 [Culex pipiens pipiens]|uniref:Uncharacterized protein n=1 Tax=Culex pipiens pipiens TaxID=38569 RepID=A0ABD1CF00_CULPP